jgi:hypothetical protein
MIKYLKNSEISFRFGLNPVNWKWIPTVAYEAPTPFYPKRKTFALVFLFLQAYLDVDDGTEDLSGLQRLFNQAMDVIDEDEVGQEIPEIGEGSFLLEQGPID